MSMDPMRRLVVVVALSVSFSHPGAEQSVRHDGTTVTQTTDSEANGYYEQVQGKLPGRKRATATPVPGAETAFDAGLGEVPSVSAVLHPGGDQGLAPASGNEPGIIASGQRPGFRNGVRNPFAPTRQILAVVAGSGTGESYRFRALAQPTKIPRMHLRGLITEGDDNVAALIEIEKSGIFMVREGDTVGLYNLGSNAVIRVRKINRLDLVVEAGSLGQILIVR